MFHAEKLYHHRVWVRVEKVAWWMAHRAARASFFVYPFRAQTKQEDLCQCVQVLAGFGHEIGQHTHFYAGTKIEWPEKENDLSDANIMHCLRRDFHYLRSIGILPKGFTAGAWLVNDLVLETLLGLGFTYDCSGRFRKPAGRFGTGYNRWQTEARIFTSTRGQLLCLPTTCSVGEWFKWGRRIKTEGEVSFRLVYLHDYDLLSMPNYFLLWLFLALTQRNPPVSAGTVAERIMAEGRI